MVYASSMSFIEEDGTGQAAARLVASIGRIFAEHRADNHDHG
jgi:hypothetical protein